MTDAAEGLAAGGPASIERSPETFSCHLTCAEDGTAEVRLGGELDLCAAPHLAEALDRALRLAATIVVDLRSLTFMDCTGLAVITAAHARARSTETDLVLMTEPGPVERLLDITGASARFQLTPG